MSGDLLHVIALVAHVAAGALALALGPAALWRSRRRGSAGYLADAYVASVLGVAVSALALVALDPGSFLWLAPVAMLTAGLVLIGRSAGRWSAPLRERVAAHGWGGSYVALVTALLVVSVSSSVVAWILPTIIGAVLIELEARRGRRSTTTGPAPRGATSAAGRQGA